MGNHVTAVLKVHGAFGAAPDHRDHGGGRGDHRRPARGVVFLDPAPEQVEVARFGQKATHTDTQISSTLPDEALDGNLVALLAPVGRIIIAISAWLRIKPYLGTCQRIRYRHRSVR